MTRAATTAGRRPLRRDAEVNLARILDAARLVFAEQGYGASMETIAERADVGVGTLYRRFPHKSELFEAVVDEAKRRNREIAEAVLDEVPDGEAVFEFVRRCVAAPSCWRATTEAPPWRSMGTGLDLLAPLLGADPGPQPAGGHGAGRSGRQRHRGRAALGAGHRRRVRHPGGAALVALLGADARRVPPRRPGRAGRRPPSRWASSTGCCGSADAGRGGGARSVQWPRMPSRSSRMPLARDSANCSSHSRSSTLPVSSAQRRGMAGKE